MASKYSSTILNPSRPYLTTMTANCGAGVGCLLDAEDGEGKGQLIHVKCNVKRGVENHDVADIQPTLRLGRPHKEYALHYRVAVHCVVKIARSRR
jgi:hypothetical protein